MRIFISAVLSALLLALPTTAVAQDATAEPAAPTDAFQLNMGDWEVSGQAAYSNLKDNMYLIVAH